MPTNIISQCLIQPTRVVGSINRCVSNAQLEVLLSRNDHDREQSSPRQDWGPLQTIANHRLPEARQVNVHVHVRYLTDSIQLNLNLLAAQLEIPMGIAL